VAAVDVRGRRSLDRGVHEVALRRRARIVDLEVLRAGGGEVADDEDVATEEPGIAARANTPDAERSAAVVRLADDAVAIHTARGPVDAGTVGPGVAISDDAEVAAVAG